MHCPRCNRNIDAGALACLYCLHKACQRELLAQQAAYMPSVVKGSLQLRICTKPPYHIQIFGDRHTAFCGVNVGVLKIRQLAYSPRLRGPDYCPGCLKALRQFIAQSQEEQQVP